MPSFAKDDVYRAPVTTKPTYNPGSIGLVSGPTAPAAPRPTAVTSSPVRVTSAPTYTPPPVTNVPTTAPPVTQPVSTPTGPTGGDTGGGGGGDDGAYHAAQQAQLEAAMRQMEAQYGLTREQIMADQTEIGDQYRFMLSALQRSREEALLSTQGGALQRGILRSGIYQTEEAKVNQEFASQESALASDKSQKLNAIQNALSELEGSFASGMAAESSGIIQQQIATMRQIADALALDDTFKQRAIAGGYQGAPGQGGGSAMGIGNATQGFGGGAAGAIADSDLLRQMRQSGQGQQLGAGYFIETRPDGTVIGGNGDGTVNRAEQYSVAGGGFGALQQGQATFGAAPVDVRSFLSTLGPDVQAGLTDQDKMNLIAAYGKTGIAPDAAYNIAASAAAIAARSQDPRYQWL